MRMTMPSVEANGEAAKAAFSSQGVAATAAPVASAACKKRRRVMPAAVSGTDKRAWISSYSRSSFICLRHLEFRAEKGQGDEVRLLAPAPGRAFARQPDLQRLPGG